MKLEKPSVPNDNNMSCGKISNAETIDNGYEADNDDRTDSSNSSVDSENELLVDLQRKRTFEQRMMECLPQLGMDLSFSNRMTMNQCIQSTAFDLSQTFPKQSSSMQEVSNLLMKHFDNDNGRTFNRSKVRKIDRNTSPQSEKFQMALPHGSSLRRSFDCNHSVQQKRRELIISKKTFLIEESLNFSKTAHLLVEANPPFRVVHANAAFYQYREECHKERFFPEQKHADDLEDAVFKMFGDSPVFVYPVLSDYKQITAPKFYLVELADGKDNGNMLMQAARAVA